MEGLGGILFWEFEILSLLYIRCHDEQHKFFFFFSRKRHRLTLYIELWKDSDYWKSHFEGSLALDASVSRQ